MTARVMRTADAAEVGEMLDWAAREGWNPGLDDAAAFLASDPAGFFVATEGRAPVACVSVVNHSDAFAFLGFYICRPDRRGHGIGLALWQHALAHAGERTVGLDGVAAQEGNYARSGFARTGATVRHEGRIRPLTDPNIRTLRPEDLATVERLDAQAGGVPRPAFLRAWMTDTPTRRTLVLQDCREVTGFATVRRCRDGAKIGPVVAPSVNEALTLAGAAAAEIASDRFILDLPSSNASLSAVLKDLGFAQTFSTARMYRGRPPESSPALQAIATMELG